MIASQHMAAFINNLAGPDLLIIGVIALLIFGKRLPEVGRSLGKGIMEFKKGLNETEQELRRSVTSELPAPPAPGVPTAPPQKTDSGQTSP
jgi:sec-independent protein translocase protein TatA